MTTQEVDKYLADLEERGLEKGLEKGRQKGRQKGERAGITRVLLDLLDAKFGPVPANVQARVAGATLAELTASTRRVLTATSFDEVLGPSPRRRRPARPFAASATPPTK